MLSISTAMHPSTHRWIRKFIHGCMNGIHGWMDVSMDWWVDGSMDCNEFNERSMNRWMDVPLLLVFLTVQTQFDMQSMLRVIVHIETVSSAFDFIETFTSLYNQHIMQLMNLSEHCNNYCLLTFRNVFYIHTINILHEWIYHHIIMYEIIFNHSQNKAVATTIV